MMRSVLFAGALVALASLAPATAQAACWWNGWGWQCRQMQPFYGYHRDRDWHHRHEWRHEWQEHSWRSPYERRW